MLPACWEIGRRTMVQWAGDCVSSPISNCIAGRDRPYLCCCSKDIRLRGLYLSQQKCMMSVPVSMSVGMFLYRRATAPKVSYLWKDHRRTGYIASTTTAVCRLCCGKFGTALTLVASLRTLTGLAIVAAVLIVPSSLKSEGWVLMYT